MGSEQYHEQSLGKEQKVGFVLLLVFGLMAVALGYLQLRNTLHNPFMVAKQDASHTVSAPLDEVLGNDARLQSIDTDQDGLNDYEELTFYETSPYIQDTDSDGIDDYSEVQTGTDPLCGEGKECSAQIIDLTPSTTITSVKPQIGNNENPLEMLGDIIEKEAPQQTEITPDDLAALQAMAEDPALIREMLLQTGQLTPEQLDQLSDEQLTTLFAQTLTDQAAALEQVPQ
ncbi:MAG: hypothetical protein HOE53_03465 [Candidatus Magasanikbacteria bacterium]|jgi:hypothetical protein|nr:hypothetical protein [Candidatus Magasanikbacteria bacterium]